jgi:ketosteroid isomerase-like protein
VSNQDVELARQVYSALNRGEITALLARFDPKIEFGMWEQFSRGTRAFRGHAGVREVFELLNENFDDFQTDPIEFIDLADHVVVPVRVHGRRKGSGDPFGLEVVQVWQIRDGKAVSIDAYSTKTEALEAVGAGGAA